MNKKQKKLWFGLGIGVLAVLILIVAKVVILPIILSLILAFLLLPLVKFLEKLKIPTKVGLLLVFAGFLLIFAGLAYWAVPKIIQEAASISQELKNSLGLLETWLAQALLKVKTALGITEFSPGFLATVAKLGAGIQEDIGNWLTRSLRVLPSFLGNLAILILAPVMSYYWLVDRLSFCKRFNALLTPSFRKNMLPLLGEINGLMRNFIKGYVLVAFLVGALFYVILLIFGVEYALSLGIIMMLAELIPYFGPFIAFVPSFFLVLLQGEGAVIKMILIWIFVQQVENLIISPKIMANSVYLHPMLVMIFVLVGGYWFGILGMILAVPVGAVLKVIIDWAYKEILQKQEADKEASKEASRLI